MGNEQSGPEQIRNNDNNEASIYFCDNVSSYQGMKSETTEKHSKKSSDEISEKTTEQATDIPDSKVPILFEWKEGGNNVVITGSFVNWQQFFQMTRNANGTFEFFINLDPGVYQFKFIVDNHWRCTEAYSKKDDGSYNTNNFIDTATLPSPSPPIKSPVPKPQLPQPIVDVPKSLYITQDGYSINTPKKTELNTEAPLLPFHYLRSFNINHTTNQQYLGKRQYLDCSERNLLSENNSYKRILVAPHVNL